jgi:glycosyltransferase involved in cell wall biosynthesis
MKKLSTSLGLSNLIWAGAHRNMPAVYNAFDIFVSSSYGEGLAVVIGEAISSGLPCVVTNVEDSAFAVGETGLVVQPKNPESLADAVCKMLEMTEQERINLGQRARQRVLKLFSINN